jgi:NADH-quinone oxidoreductase subunit F
VGGPQLKESLADYSRRGGFEALGNALRGGRPAAVVETIERAHLCGRGGTGTATATKLVRCAQAQGAVKYLVVNGAEVEPGSFKDRKLLEYTPHAVLEGALLAAYAVGASRIIFYVHQNHEEARRRVQGAIQEAAARGWLGEGIQGSSFSPQTDTVAAPPSYVAGEETAALEAVEGKPALPRRKPSDPLLAGLHSKPTLVQNVETLANFPPILLNGAEWYRSIGTQENPGTRLYSLNTEWERPGVYELPHGAREGELLQEMAGGLKSGAQLRAILPGSCGNAFLQPDPERILSPESLRAAGSGIGSGVMRGYPVGACMLEAALELARFFEKECCDQCPACRTETTALVAVLEKIRHGQGDASALEEIFKLLAAGKDQGDCCLVNMPAAPLLSAMRLFRRDFDAHLATGRCRGT